MGSSLEIVHLCSSDIQGGAARSAYRLHKAMQDAGMASRMCVRDKQSKDDSVSVLGMRRSFGRLAGRLGNLIDAERLARIRARRGRNMMFSPDTVPWSHDKLPRHDVLNLHWVSGFIDCHDIVEMMPESRLLVWTLHDMNPFTGGCHFSGDCRKYEAGCSNCPVLGTGRAHDLASKAWKRKKCFFDTPGSRRIHFVSPSRWLARTAQASPFLAGQKVSVIPYGVDLKVYRPGDSAPMRSVLNIPADMRVILLLSARLSDRRKGGEAFLKELVASGLLADGKNMLLTVGRDMPSLDASVPCRAVGAVDNEALLAGLYNCADVLLMPTLEDNLPNAALEAISCGIPVVSYDTGGMPDIIGDQEAGLLVPRGDVGALLAGLRNLLGDPAGLKLKKAAARYRAEQDYSKELQASRYRSLYGELLHNTNKQPVI